MESGEAPAGSSAPWVPGKASPVARWRRLVNLADQALQASESGDSEKVKALLEAIRAIATLALRDFEEAH